MAGRWRGAGDDGDDCGEDTEAAAVPPCALRAAGCRWFAERGPEVCLSCQWVVSEGATVAGSAADRERLAGVTPVAPMD